MDKEIIYFLGVKRTLRKLGVHYALPLELLKKKSLSKEAWSSSRMVENPQKSPMALES